MIKTLLPILLLLSNLAMAGEKVVYQNWTAELNGKTNEAYTVADASNSLGLFCSGEQCLFYLRQGLQCSPGAKYPVLMNSQSVSTALTMECTLINGNLIQILTSFDAVLRATQVGDNIGFAVALQSGAFAVASFSLLGARSAIEKVLSEASRAKNHEQKIIPAPQILLIPPMPVLPQTPQNVNPKRPQNQPKKSDFGDLST